MKTKLCLVKAAYTCACLGHFPSLGLHGWTVLGNGSAEYSAIWLPFLSA